MIGPVPLESVSQVRVGTRNGPKLEAVRCALEALGREPRVEGVDVESGVPEQPVGFGEIARGARNRARAAFESGPCDLAVGIEDGLVVLPDVHAEAFNIGCAWVTDGVRESPGLSSGFAYPAACSEPALRGGQPIGEVFDALWRERGTIRDARPSALSVGNIGRLTEGVLTRAEYGRHAVLCALVRFLHPDLYFAEAEVAG